MSLFEPYQVSADSVREAAEQSTAGIDELLRLRADVDVEHRSALAAVEGDIRPYVETAPDASGRHSQAIVERLSFARGGAHMFAIAIDDFNTDSGDPRSVSKLNAAYDAAAADHFGVDAGEYTKNEGGLPTLDKSRYSGAVTVAKEALIAELTAEYGRLDKQLDAAAAEIATMLKGKDPSDADVRAMFAAGALPSYAALLFPDVNFSGLKVVRLPTDLRGKSNEAVAEYVLRHDPEFAVMIARSLPPAAQRAVAVELAARLEDLDPGDSEGLRAAEDLAGLLAAFGGEPVGLLVVDELGAKGTAGVLDALAAPYLNDGGSGGHKEALRRLQDSIATSLALMVANASRTGLSSSFGSELAKASQFATALIFRYGEKQHAVFDGDFLVAAGNAIREDGEQIDFQYPEDRGRKFGTDVLDAGDMIALSQLLEVADNHRDSAQALMGDRELATYLLTERDVPQSEEQTARVLRLATIQQATVYDPTEDEPSSEDFWAARQAAEISSMVIDIAGDGKKPLDAYDTEIAGILSTYIADVDRTYATGDPGGPGIYDHLAEGWDAHITDVDGFPPFGIMIDSDDLRDVLVDVGDNDDARKLLAQTATAFNQLRIDRHVEDMTAWISDGSNGQSPLAAAATSNSQFTGYLVDALSEGKLDHVLDEENARKQVAKLFAYPLGFLPKAGPGGEMIVDWVKQQVDKGVVGGGVAIATEEANDAWGESRQQILAQTYDAMRAETQRFLDDRDGGQHTQLLTDDQIADWPKDANGALKPFSTLAPEDQAELLQGFRGDPGFSGDAKTAVENSYDNYTEHWR